jgi:hypothetical protein
MAEVASVIVVRIEVDDTELRKLEERIAALGVMLIPSGAAAALWASSRTDGENE